MTAPGDYPDEAQEVFDFVIAETLHMSVEDVHARLSTDELSGWQAFFWARSVHREQQSKRQANLKSAKGKGRRG